MEMWFGFAIIQQSTATMMISRLPCMVSCLISRYKSELRPSETTPYEQVGGNRKPQLNDRELAVLRLLSDGRTECEIGKELGLSERTVRNCLTSIRSKLGVKRRPEAIAEAVRLGFIE